MERNIFVLVSKHKRPKAAGDLEKQSFYRFIYKTYILHPIALAILLYVIGGTPFFIWGTCEDRNVFTHNIYSKLNMSYVGKSTVENRLVNLIAFGEGWHNNHHAFEYSARIGLEWWEMNFGWYVIKFLEVIGVATDVKVPSHSHKQRLAMDKPKQATPTK